MEISENLFDEHEVLHELEHYLPSQAPLKDFVHHNPLHAFQHKKFYEALHQVAEIFGYKTTLSIDEYRQLYHTNRIRKDILEKIIIDKKGEQNFEHWKEKLIHTTYQIDYSQRVGHLRKKWKKYHHIDLDSLVHPKLFRILASYLDQGISIWEFPTHHYGFLTSIREIEKTSFTSFFKTKRVKRLLLLGRPTIKKLLDIIVGDERYYRQYLFGQQFSHPGWSGMVAFLEKNPDSLLDTRKISLHDLIILELLLEIDALESELGKDFRPLGNRIGVPPIDITANFQETEYHEVITLWQDAFEWSYYDDVLAAIKIHEPKTQKPEKKSFQALFCIDDREGSLRRHIEHLAPDAETFGTPGFFGVAFYYKPLGGKSYTKLCPVPVTPKHLIKEVDVEKKMQKDLHFHQNSQTLLHGWLISQTLGFWSAFKLFLTVFRPTFTPATASSLAHMDKKSKLTIHHRGEHNKEDGLQIGYTIPEMADIVESVLKSIGLIKDFANLVYIVGHGSTTVNNPHYAAYDCGACSGRAGSVNARIFAYMANREEVREILEKRNLCIPKQTQFVGTLHDTTRDDFVYYDEELLLHDNLVSHVKNQQMFAKALDLNAKERARRFDLIDLKDDSEKIHEKIRKRSISLFEPRPELNHATDAICIVGRRQLSRGLFLDRRSFLNSYDYSSDPEGNYLLNILSAAAPVCGGINLEYYFSRVDNQKLGVGTKLPLNVLSLIGVANGVDGDLRTGLPSQMVEVHDPIRLMMIVEHFPEVVLKTIQCHPPLYEWFENQWLHLAVVHPENRALFYFDGSQFVAYEPIEKEVHTTQNIDQVIEQNRDGLPVYITD